MQIVVDAKESRSGLPSLLAANWNDVVIRSLEVGDVALGHAVIVERKTTEDLLISIEDGRLFRQARQLAGKAERPILIQEGDSHELIARMGAEKYRGLILALTVGFRIPVLKTPDVQGTAALLRHMAAQECQREARRRQRDSRTTGTRRNMTAAERKRLSPDAIEILMALPGIGRMRAEMLAEHLESLGDLARLGVRDLLCVPGIGPDTAARIVDLFRAPRPSPPPPPH